jgi:hypothetical protein
LEGEAGWMRCGGGSGICGGMVVKLQVWKGSGDLEIFRYDCLNWNAILALQASTRRRLARILNCNTVYDML